MNSPTTSNTARRPPLRFIPFRKRDIVEMCVASGDLSAADQMKFRDFCRLLQSVFHFEYHDMLEAIKDSYAPLNPDRDTRKVGVYKGREEVSFADLMEELLNKANYEKLTDADLQAAFEESSLFRLRLHIDFRDFENVLLFTRGESVRTERLMRFFGLWQKEIRFSNYDRVVIYIRFSEHLKAIKGGQRPGTTMLKMFQNVPKADVEMLFPNTRLGMRTVDKLMIGVPAVVGGGVILTTKVGTSLLLLGALIGFWLGLSGEPQPLDQTTLIALAAGIGGLGSFIWKQFVNFKNRKLTFMQALTENLYFKNLDNNAGVFHRLIDDAEEEECKEAILGYYFLLTHQHIDTPEQLDRMVETWFADRWKCHIDFEVEDAMAKLEKLGLVSESTGELTPADLDEACRILDQRWDDYFSYHSGEPSG